MKRLTYAALDGEILTFDVPKSCNKYLVEKAIKRLHHGEDADIVSFGLTRSETIFVAEVAAKLEEHRPAKTEAA